MNDVLSNYCGDCAAASGERHNTGCDVARCTECGGQYISCGCETGGPTIWTGTWPGIMECVEFGWYTAPDSPWGETEDLNRLYMSAEVEWSRERERWVLK